LDVVEPNPNYAGITDVAYTARFDKENIGPTGPATIVMSVNTTWVREHSQQYVIPTDFDTDPTGALISIDGVPRGTTPLTIPLPTGSHLVGLYMAGYEYKQATINVTSDSMRVIRIGDDGVSSILNTTLLWSDPEAGLDYYQASSPDGLSTFAIAGLNRHGNPFQLFTLFWTSHVSTGGGGGGGGGYTSSLGSGVGGGSTETASNVTPTQTPVTTATEISAALTTPENRSGTSNFASTINPDESLATEALAAPPTTVAVQPPVPNFGKTPLGIISGMIVWIGELTRGRYIFIFAAVAITVVSVIAIWKRGYIGQE
ncbi:MAG: PEGA domain-containing protein, partial [Methanoregulaceae archaeon]|nr:PEGA domain-containing protein [Methanoregulaceae archaeon]